jgi:FtsZ-binding cell division protein ZapB
MMLEKIATDTTIVLTGAGGFVGLALYLRRVFKNLGLEDSRRDAEREVIDTLRAEVDRLARTNTTMSQALSELQVEIIKLRNENITLTGEIGALRNENAQLTAEVLKLNDQIKDWGSRCDTCQYKPQSTTP